MIPGVFVTGTGTGVGKTIVTAGLLRLYRKLGINAAPMKPVQTGAYLLDGQRAAPDLDFVLSAADMVLDQDTRPHSAPYCYAPACSPHLAAQLAGENISVDTILEHARCLSESYELLVIEGAGGLLAPLNESETMAGLAKALNLPVILVGYSGLGGINHALLSIEAMRSRNLNLLGVVLCDTSPVPPGDEFIHADNSRIIASMSGVSLLARVPFLGSPLDWNPLDAVLRYQPALLDLPKHTH